MSDTQAALNELLEEISSPSAAPVKDWDPPVTRNVDIRIARNADWYYQGSLIQRARMVKLFSTVLRVDDDGHTYLVTPQERLRITVDDAPFTAILVERHGAHKSSMLVFTTNVGEKVIADASHPISVRYLQRDGEPSPYVLVRDRLQALINRATYYQMVEWAEERQGVIGIESCGVFMPLGSSAWPGK